MKRLRICVLFPVLCGVAASLSAQTPSNGTSSADAIAAPHAQDKSADRALRKDVMRALSRTKGLNTTQITVRVKSGVVMLQGSVPDQSEVDLATRAALNTSGVTSVKNTLTVLGPAGSQ